MLKSLIILVVLILVTSCTTKDNIFYYYQNVHNTPVIQEHINYTSMLRTWIKTVVPADVKETWHQVTDIASAKDGTLYFTVELAYDYNDIVFLEHHFLTVTPKGTVQKSKLIDRVMNIELDGDEEQEAKEA